MACTLVTFRARSALRDVGKALGLPEALLASLKDRVLEPETSSAEVTEQLTLLQNLCRQLHGFPRHLGIHNGGMVITSAPLARRLPTEPATMPGRVVVQWDKEALETAGLIKIDLLGLRMLSALAEAEQLISDLAGQSPPLDRLSFDDPAVYDLIARADTLGVFQVESRAQAQILPRLKPRCFEDLIVTISLIRPGPIQGHMVHPYLRRRLGQEPVTYLHPRLESALADTMGVILFQEQVLKVARDLAGFSPGQGELLRRALGHKDGTAEIARLKEAFIAGARANGVPLDIAETVFMQLQAFGGYSFAKSHAAAFAVLVYQSAWLKCYYPAAFYISLFNNWPMGFWPPAVLLGDARRRGLTVLPVDLQHSQARCSLEGEAIRLGFNYVDLLGKSGCARLVTARQAGPFGDLADLCRRTRLPRRLVEQLILAGALDGWHTLRRQLLWELGQLHYRAEELPLDFAPEAVDLPPLTRTETLAWERQVLGLSTGEHVMTFYRPWLVEQGILGSRDLVRQPDGATVRVAGLVVVHQAPPTAKGFHFFTLEDEYGLMDVVIRPAIYTRYRQVIRHEPRLIVAGPVQRQEGVVNVLARQIIVLPGRLAAASTL